MYFGGRLPPESRPKKQSTLKGIFKKGLKDETGVPILKYDPESPQALQGGATIGISTRFRIFTGRDDIGPLSKETTTGGDELEKLIKPYGFASGFDGFELDHVHEIQLGGLAQNNVVPNLWPLESAKNSRKGRSLASSLVTYPKDAKEKLRIATLKTMITPETDADGKFYFKIESTD
jgi:hypothetical protein